MAAFEDEFVYSMMLRDCMCILPEKVRSFADTTTWPDDVNEKGKRGSLFQRKTKPTIVQLAPAVEESLLRPMFDLKSPLDHQVDLVTRSGRLVQNMVNAANRCRTNLGPFIKMGEGGWESAMLSLGNMAHFIIDVMNPFNLVAHDAEVDKAAAYFMQSLKIYHEDLPFFWAHVNEDMTVVMKVSPYFDPLAISVEAERCRDKFYEAIGNRYLFGNGYPAARPLVQEWYNIVVNALGRAIWCCAS